LGYTGFAIFNLLRISTETMPVKGLRNSKKRLYSISSCPIKTLSGKMIRTPDKSLWGKRKNNWHLVAFGELLEVEHIWKKILSKHLSKIRNVAA